MSDPFPLPRPSCGHSGSPSNATLRERNAFGSLFFLALLSLASSVSRGQMYGDYQVISDTILADAGGTQITKHGRGLAFDGTDLWYTAVGPTSATSVLYRIDPGTRQITASFPLPFKAHGIAWNGASLLIADTETEPRIREYDRQGNLLGSQLVEASTERFEGICWDGERLWGSDDWLLFRFEPDGKFSRLHSTSWTGVYSGLTWDGTHLVAMVDFSAWTQAFGPYTVRIDPVTGNLSDYRNVGTNSGSENTHHIAAGGGRMWIVKGGGLPARLYEVVPPPAAPTPFAALEPAWGAFVALDGFAVPQRSGFIGGASLCAVGSDFWYGDYYNISKVRWNDTALNTAALDVDWRLAGGAEYDIASDGTRVWTTSFGTTSRVNELNLRGEVVGNFVLPIPVPEVPEGLAWDGAALWVATAQSESQGVTVRLRRFTPQGQLLRGPIIVGADEANITARDMAWHNGELWILEDIRVLRVDPATGVVLGRYLAGPLNAAFTGIASNGANLFVTARPKRVGAIAVAPPGEIFPMILRLGMPGDMIPPVFVGAAATTSQITFHFSEVFSADLILTKKLNYQLECPPGNPIDLSPASVTLTPDYNGKTKATLAGLTLPAGSTYQLTARLLRDPTGNIMREDGAGNVLIGVVGGMTAPSVLTASELTPNRITLSWHDAGTDETSFLLERRDGPAGNWVQIADLPTANGPGFGGLLTYVDTQVAPGGEYAYRVRASQASGTSPYSNVAVASLVDTDADGWSDPYETNVTHTDPLRADTDSDGARDSAEAVAGTDPNNSASVFKITEISLAGDRRLTLRWSGVAGKMYRIVRSATPGFESIEIEAQHLPGVSPVTSYTTPTALPVEPAKGFYRIEVE